MQQVCYTFTSYHLKYSTEGLNYGQLTTCRVALYLVKFLSWGISWLGLNDAGDTRKFTTSSFIQFWYFRNAGHLADFYFNSPVNSCSPCIRNWWKLNWKLDRNWLPWAAIFPLHKSIIFFTTRKNQKWLSSYRRPSMNCEDEWTKFSREMSIFKKEIEHEVLLMNVVHQLRKMIRQLPFPSRSPRSRRNIPRLHPIPR